MDPHILQGIKIFRSSSYRYCAHGSLAPENMFRVAPTQVGSQLGNSPLSTLVGRHHLGPRWTLPETHTMEGPIGQRRAIFIFATLNDLV